MQAEGSSLTDCKTFAVNIKVYKEARSISLKAHLLLHPVLTVAKKMPQGEGRTQDLSVSQNLWFPATGV